MTRVLVAHKGADLYGSDLVMLASVRAFVGNGWHVTATLPNGGASVASLEAAGAEVSIQSTPVLRRSALSPKGFVGLMCDAGRSLGPSIGLLRRVRPDIVYVSTVTLPMWLLLGRLSGAEVACHSHEAEAGHPRVLRLALATPLRLARTIIANSRFTARLLADASSRLAARTVVVSNPIPSPEPVIEARGALDDAVQLIFIGRLSPRKGPQLAVEALGELHARGVDAELTLVGSVFPGYEWFEEELVGAVSRLGLQRSVRWRGFTQEIGEQIASADIVLVPSVESESFGNIAVEALLAQRPVVVSRNEGLTEAVSGLEAAVMVEPGDSTAIADAVERIASQWLHYRGAAARDAVVAGGRHDPATYERNITDAVLGGASNASRGSIRPTTP